MTVRPLTDEDCENVAKLFANSFKEHIMVNRGLLSNPSYIINRLKNPDESWVVEEDNGMIRGVSALAICFPVGLGEIERVCVDVPHRGNGVALSMCNYLVNLASEKNLGFVEAFARGNEPAMQRTFDKLGFRVYGVAPRFEVVHNGQIVREQFVHMGLELKPESIDNSGTVLISQAQKVFERIYSL